MSVPGSMAIMLFSEESGGPTTAMLHASWQFCNHVFQIKLGRSTRISDRTNTANATFLHIEICLYATQEHAPSNAMMLPIFHSAQYHTYTSLFVHTARL
jgi:hypothetical protein